MKRTDMRNRRIALPLAAAVSAAAILAASCGSAPRPAEAAAVAPAASTASAQASKAPVAASAKAAPGAKASSKVAVASSVKPTAPAAKPAPPPSPYLQAALSQYSSRGFANGLVLAVKRQPGRAAAAARIALAPASYPERLAGLPALALACAAKGAAGSAPGGFEAALYRLGASLELRTDDRDDVALELLCPLPSLEPALEAIAKSLAAPAFRQDDFERVLGEFRVAERREDGDPEARSAIALRAEAYLGHACALPPRGTAASLGAMTREDVVRFWAEGAGAERLRVAVVGDLDPARLALALEPCLAAIPRHGADPSPLASPKASPMTSPSTARDGLPSPRSLAIAEALPAAAGKAFVRAELGVPDASSPDYAALAVALAMIDDILDLGLPDRAGAIPPARAAQSSLPATGAGSAILWIPDCADPVAARAAFRAAAELLAAGRCLDARDRGTVGDIGASLEAYRLRAVAKSYAKADGSAQLAARIARDLAAGGDGTAFFRMADRIAAVGAADVARVARERLVEGPAAWIALGDPKVIAGFAAPAAK